MAQASDLFRALELAHYAERFRDQVFVIGLTAETSFQSLLLDLKVLTGYRIQAVLVLPDPAFRLEGLIEKSNSRGTRFRLSLLTEVLFETPEAPPSLDFARIRSAMQQGETPVLAFHPGPEDPREVDRTFRVAAQVAAQLGAGKLFLLSPRLVPLVDACARSHYLAGEIAQLQAGLPGAEGPAFAPLLAFVREQLQRGIPDVVLGEDRAGHLFREVFTHDGAGILFNQVGRTLIRPARTRDVTDIALLLQAEIEEGRILPVDENEIESQIASYRVYEIEGLLVGAARLKAWGNWVELAQFATLPRYRGKGRARELAQHLEQEARAGGVERLFALSIDERMWGFFLSLGFAETPRENLPVAWREQYDLQRPSHAFVKELV